MFKGSTAALFGNGGGFFAQGKGLFGPIGASSLDDAPEPKSTVADSAPSSESSSDDDEVEVNLPPASPVETRGRAAAAAAQQVDENDEGSGLGGGQTRLTDSFRQKKKRDNGGK